MRKFPASFNIGLANCRKKVEDAKPYDCGFRIADGRIEKKDASVFINPQLAERKEIKVENALD